KALYTGNLDIVTSFGASYERLSDEERALFRRLRLLLEPRFEARMAEVLLDCGERGARDALSRLVDEHLVVRADDGRHRFDDLIGLDADGRLAQDEPRDARDATTRRLLRVYLAEVMERAMLLDPAIAAIGGGEPPAVPALADQLRVLDWFEQERARLAAAWRM